MEDGLRDDAFFVDDGLRDDAFFEPVFFTLPFLEPDFLVDDFFFGGIEATRASVQKGSVNQRTSAPLSQKKKLTIFSIFSNFELKKKRREN